MAASTVDCKNVSRRGTVHRGSPLALVCKARHVRYIPMSIQRVPTVATHHRSNVGLNTLQELNGHEALSWTSATCPTYWVGIKLVLLQPSGQFSALRKTTAFTHSPIVYVGGAGNMSVDSHRIVLQLPESTLLVCDVLSPSDVATA